MLWALLAFAFAPIPAGAYSMAELCAQLRTATGTGHSVANDLRDYPVFVATKTGDPARVRALVAAALRAEWVKDKSELRLVPAKVNADAEFGEFERQYQAACKGMADHLALPLRDLFKMAPGQLVRYGYPSNALYRPLPQETQKAILASGKESGFVLVHRQSEGHFDFRMNLPRTQTGAFYADGKIDFRLLPKSVEEALGEELARNAMSAEDQDALRKRETDPGGFKFDWSDLAKRDPVAAWCEPILTPLAKSITPDLALVLPDQSLMASGTSAAGPRTVRSILESFSQVLNWAVVEGAVVGRMPLSERVAPAQVRRDVMGRYLQRVGVAGVADVAVWSDYVSSQRPAASDTWSDAIMLVIAGNVLDDTFIGDYPYNLRLYTRLDRNDWALLRSGPPFLASAFSQDAREALRNLLLNPMTRLERNAKDPASWITLDPKGLEVSATIVEEEVLIGWTGFSARVDRVSSSGMEYEGARAKLAREPLYQPAIRRKLTLQIRSVASREEVESGFTEVVPSASVKPTTWEKLPEAIAKVFREGLEEWRKLKNQRTGPPPPQ